MDNFGGGYAGKHQVQHLIDYLQKKYIIIVGWSGKNNWVENRVKLLI